MGDEGWAVHADGSLRYRGRIVVPQLTNLREEILKEFHCSRFAVHPGGMKMYQDLRRQYYWSGMKRHVGDFVRRCLTCQQVKAEHQKLAGLLQPLEMAEWKWEHVTMDFVTHLPRTQQKHDAVWVIVDRLTKSAHFLAVRMTFALERFCRLYIREIVRLHGVSVDPEKVEAVMGWEMGQQITSDEDHDCFGKLTNQFTSEGSPLFYRTFR